MKYERLTKRNSKGDATYAKTVKSSYVGAIYEEHREIEKEVLNRLAALEDMIEKGTLIPRYFVQKDELPNGTVWHNVCSFNEYNCSIEWQCRTPKEAEQLLEELIKEHSEGK